MDKKSTAPMPTFNKDLPKLNRKAYEKELKRLQAELVDMQQWVVETGARVVIIMEGRDAAGKGSAIKRITQYLNPRSARIEALPTPNSREKGQWYFQRYIEKLPTAGEIVIFDRSWYNRAGVERVMGFCTSQEYRRFLHQAPIFERLLVEDGIHLRKYWFSVSDEEQLARFQDRLSDPLRRWKLSPMDLQSITKWEEYSRAKDEMFIHTDIPSAPWYTVESEDKKRSRINVISHILNTIPYEKINRPLPEIPERPERHDDYARPPRNEFRYVPDLAACFEEDRVAAAKEERKAEKKATREEAEKKAAQEAATLKAEKKKARKEAERQAADEAAAAKAEKKKARRKAEQKRPKMAVKEKKTSKATKATKRSGAKGSRKK